MNAQTPQTTQHKKRGPKPKGDVVHSSAAFSVYGSKLKALKAAAAAAGLPMGRYARDIALKHLEDPESLVRRAEHEGFRVQLDEIKAMLVTLTAQAR